MVNVLLFIDSFRLSRPTYLYVHLASYKYDTISNYQNTSISAECPEPANQRRMRESMCSCVRKREFCAAQERWHLEAWHAVSYFVNYNHMTVRGRRVCSV